MLKSAFAIAAGFLSLCLPVLAQEQIRPLQIDGDVFALNNAALFRRYPTLSLNGGPFAYPMVLNWLTGPVAQVNSMALQETNVPAKAGRSLSDRLADWVPKVDYASGEVGFLYGRSTGKFGGDLMRGYIIGEVGDDKVHITVGAAYEDSNWHFPRAGR